MAKPVASLALAWLLVLPALVPAHYNMLLPSAASAQKGEAVTLTYQWGHPYEHELFDAPPPARLVVQRPDGKTADLTKTLEKIKLPGADRKEVTAYRFTYTPESRGDFVFVLDTPPIWMEEEQEFLQDSVRTVVHVLTQRGWDLPVADGDFAVQPLTRPYGLVAGTVFQARFMGRQGSGNPPLIEGNLMPPPRPRQPLADLLVEVERYNPTPPRSLPPDEQRTRTAKTDPNGIVTCTLSEAGWWCVAGQQRRGTGEKRDGKEYPVRQRAIHWVFVDEKVAPRGAGD